MAEHPTSTDISDMPDLLRVVEEVRASNQPWVLTRDGERLAVLFPLGGPRAKSQGEAPTSEQLEASQFAAVGWAGTDADRLIEDIYEERGSARPPVEL